MRAHIFIDFWNFQLSVNDAVGSTYRPDWQKIPLWIIQESAAVIGRPLSYEGTHLYISYSPTSSKDASLRNFATSVLSRMPGMDVSLVERKAQSAPICPHCYQAITVCPHCSKTIIRTVEKGVDTAIVTDMLKFAWEGAMDLAILVSSDRDFIPVVELLAAKGFKSVNAHFPPRGMHLAGKCWASIDLQKGLAAFARTAKTTP
ncbi:MAG: NYN domain-containing protein [Chloroflexi bacterium]|nr:NYN domain-containing protein [Chloroflexota bacterium]